ncbi:MAG: SCO family protein [Proteobacteria bacterium]|nr:SCO family protein [Pseudomonadota bacterium]
MTKTSTRVLLIAAALAATVIGFYVARQIDRPAPQLASGTWFPQARAIPDFSLVDTGGATVTRAVLVGHPSLLFFGFTHCPDVCPTTLIKLAAASRQAAVPNLKVVFISIDPGRDTPEVVGRYVHAFDPGFEGLTGTPQAVAKLARSVGVVVARVEQPGGDYTMDHSAVVFLTNDAGKVVAVFTPPFDEKLMAQDLKASAPHLAGGH